MSVYCPECGREHPDNASVCTDCGEILVPSGGSQTPPLLDNRYEVQSIVKSGNMGCVYKAFDTRLQVVVALKKMISLYDSKEEKEYKEKRFFEEARLLSTLHHGGLPKVTDFFVDIDTQGQISHYLVITLIEGSDLESRLKSKILPLPLKEVINYALQIAEILRYLHSRTPPVVYRDLKPSNIMLHNDRLFLVDFGIAKVMEKGRQGTMIGTPGYASPDQCKGLDIPANDIYSFGTLIHYLLTGRNPEDPSCPMFTFEPIKSVNSMIPEHIDLLVASMVELVSAKRPRIEAVIRELKRDDDIDPTVGTIVRQMTGIINPVLIQTPSTNVGSRDSLGRTSLHRAAENNDLKTAQMLLSGGADVNARDYEGKTPLYIAASQNFEDMVSLLFSGAADVNSEDNGGKTPLHCAVDNNSIGTVNLLISKGADVNAADDDGETPLHYAAKKDFRDTAHFLISGGAAVNTADRIGRMPLHIAAGNNATDTVSLLISAGADVNFVDNKGRTPLDWASGNNSWEIVSLLRSNDGYKGSELGSGKKKQDKPIAGSIDVTLRDGQGRTPLHRAVEINDIQTVQMLINNGADVDARDNDEETPLHFAAWENAEDIAAILISGGANVNIKNKKGMTPLHYASWTNAGSTAEFLLSKGANVNAKDNKGKTPLHLALEYNSMDTAYLLISTGAEVNAKTNLGETPLDFAEKSGGSYDLINYIHKYRNQCRDKLWRNTIGIRRKK